MSPAVSRRREATMSIGEVIAQLVPDFPDVSVSKIRLWEAEGLVDPARTASGYRKFTHDDVARLRYAMTLQRDQFWPLRKIRDHLDAVARGAEDPVQGASGPRVATGPIGDSGDLPPRATATSVRLTAAELCARSGLPEQELDALGGFGLLQPSGSGWYDETDLAVACAAAELAVFGIQARHLRPFRTSADREVGLVEQVTSPLRAGRGGQAQARAQDTAREITAITARLQAALVRAGLTRAGLG